MWLEPPKRHGNNSSDASICFKEEKKLLIYLNTLGGLQYILDYNIKLILTNMQKKNIWMSFNS